MSKKREQKALALKLRKRIARRLKHIIKGPSRDQVLKVKKYGTTFTSLPPIFCQDLFTTEKSLDKYLTECYRFCKALPPLPTKIGLPSLTYQALENQVSTESVKPSYISGLGIDVYSNPSLPPNTIVTVSQEKYTLFSFSGQEATVIAEFPKIDFFKIPPPRLERNLYAKRNE